MRQAPHHPRLIDSHMHIIRGGLNYNMESCAGRRADAGRCNGDAERQVDNTPAPQWVRCGRRLHRASVREKRLPTIAELNAVAPDTPVFILHLYDRALLNAAALRVVGYSKDNAQPAGWRDRARRGGQPNRPAARQAQCDDPLFDARQGTQAAARYQLNSTAISCAR